jgi:hypothetical protein
MQVIPQLTLLIDGDVVLVSQEVFRFLGDKWIFIVDVCSNQWQCQVIGGGNQCVQSSNRYRIGKRRIERAFEGWPDLRSSEFTQEPNNKKPLEGTLA